jgi:mannitol-1-/sugar-/sorbitol-6-phosphatase
VFVFGEHVKNGKPYPECYNLAMQSLGVKSSECLVYEDSSIGIEAAESSGASVIDVSGWMKMNVFY